MADEAGGHDFASTLHMAREGNPRAMYIVARHLLAEGTGRYDSDAFGWALNAARSGHPEAATLTGKLYRLGTGIDKNYVKARKWLFRARSRGAAGANFELALLFNDKDNPAFDEEAAARHMADALSRNEPRACLVAAIAKIESGRPIRNALKELSCAANGGIQEAMLAIADYYATKRSPNAVFNAKQWLQKAADAGNETAIQRLADLE